MAGWRFLVFSGSFSSRVIVEQDREQHTVSFQSQFALSQSSFITICLRLHKDAITFFFVDAIRSVEARNDEEILGFMED